MRIPVKKPSYTEDYYNTNWLELHGCVKEINKCCGFPLIVSLVIIHFPLQNLTLRYCAYLLKAVSELFLSRTLACTNFKQHNHHIVQMLVLCLLPPLWTLTRSLSLTQETTTSVTTCGTMYSKNPLLSTKWMKGKKSQTFHGLWQYENMFIEQSFLHFSLTSSLWKKKRISELRRVPLCQQYHHYNIAFYLLTWG